LDEIQESLGSFDGPVSENGNNLSGGQRQRLALARVMLQEPQLIIFDEATSALDNTNEAIIQENIERIFHHKTVITIAHRLTTLKNADRILVFDAGKIVQEGDFKHLSETKGLFQDFLQQRSKPQPGDLRTLPAADGGSLGGGMVKPAIAVATPGR